MRDQWLASDGRRGVQTKKHHTWALEEGFVRQPAWCTLGSFPPPCKSKTTCGSRLRCLPALAWICSLMHRRNRAAAPSRQSNHLSLDSQKRGLWPMLETWQACIQPLTGTTPRACMHETDPTQESKHPHTDLQIHVGYCARGRTTSAMKEEVRHAPIGEPKMPFIWARANPRRPPCPASNCCRA